MEKDLKSPAQLMPLENTIKEVYQQPEVVDSALRNNHNSVCELAKKIIDEDIKKILIVGSGDSMFMGLSVQQAFHSYSGITCSVKQAYEYAVFGEIESNDIAIFVVSSSGRISTTRDALNRALNSSALVVGVTDNRNEENPFFSLPKYVLVPGGQKIGWPTQTTTSTIAIFIDLAIQIGKLSGNLEEKQVNNLYENLMEIPLLMQHVLDKNSLIMRQIAEKFVGRKSIYFIGSGPGYGVANIGGALMAEGPQKIGIPLYVEEFHHSLRINTVDPDMPIFLIAPNDPAFSRYLDTVSSGKKWGGYLIAITDSEEEYIFSNVNSSIIIPKVPYQMSPLLSVLPLHLFCIELTQMVVKMGHLRPWYSV
ncbi:MAG TPA: hypothetical protein DDX29_11935 [Clostridiales bacterium]|nr:hypothetical protein [Clostridiales bacterium]